MERTTKATSTQSLDEVKVRLVEEAEVKRWNQLMAKHHYLGFRTIVGQSLKYVATLDDQWVALLGWGTAAFKCGPRDRWIGWSTERPWDRLKFIANNQRFLILPNCHHPNLASKVLALNTRRLSNDWQAIYNHPIVLVETFVDPARFRGTCYRAAGWLPLGQTRGFGRRSGRYIEHGQPKTILVRPLRSDACSLLNAPFLHPHLKGEHPAIMDLNKLKISSLLNILAKVSDPRKRRGIRHSTISVLAISVCACLAGNRSFTAIGEWAASLDQKLLKRFGCRRNPHTGKYEPPSEPTIRRILQTVDGDEVDSCLGGWLFEAVSGGAIAVDGKTLRGSGHGERRPIHLIAAVLHNEGLVLNQKQIAEKSNEIPAFKPTLQPLDLKDFVVTADALHLQKKHAHFLKEEKEADYLFTVKANQPGLLQSIEDLDNEDFSPSACRARQRPRPHRKALHSGQ